MPPVIVNAMEKAKTTVQSFNFAQKTLSIIGIAVLVLGGIVLYSWIGQPSYKTLYTGLTDKDQSSVVEQLKADGISYQIADGGTVKVAADKIYDARMSLAANNLPASPTLGYAVLDTLGVAASDFQQKMAEKRAIEGELSRTIQSMEGVRTATVLLAQPKETVFADTKAKTPVTASVTVIGENGKELDTKAVEAIIKMVSSSVPDLSPDKVTVVDGAGKTISDNVTGGGAALVEEEARVKAAVENVLNPVVGPGNAIVSVNIDTAKNNVEKVTTVYTDPVGGTKVLAESKQGESYNGNGTVVGGVLGPDSIGNPNQLNGNNGSDYKTDQNTTNYGVNSEVTRSTEAPGSIATKSVSVIVNQETARRLDMDALLASASAAAGINAERGDVINVSRMPFDTATKEAQEKAAAEAVAAEKAQATADLIRQAIVVGVIILLLIIVAAIAKRRARKRAREALDLGELDQLPEPFTLTPPEEEIPLALEAPVEEEYIEPEPPKPDPVMLRLEAKRQEIADLALDKPGLLAEQLRSWMARR